MARPVQDEAKRERRSERQRAAAEARRRAASRQRARRAAEAATVGVAVLAAGWFLVRPDPEVAGRILLPVERDDGVASAAANG